MGEADAAFIATRIRGPNKPCVSACSLVPKVFCAGIMPALAKHIGNPFSAVFDGPGPAPIQSDIVNSRL